MARRDLEDYVRNELQVYAMRECVELDAEAMETIVATIVAGAEVSIENRIASEIHDLVNGRSPEVFEEE